MKKKVIKEIREWVVTILLGFLLAIVIQKTAFALYVVEGTSMMPTLKDNERVFVNRIPLYFKSFHHGDIVVFPNPIDERNFVKRIVGLPGDTIEIREGRVYRNGNPLQEPYVDTVTVGDMPPTIVIEDHVFVMGDNRHVNGSWDSRSPEIGQIPFSKLAGEVKFVVFPVPHGIK